MCGIVACIAEEKAHPAILNEPKRLEYPGFYGNGVALSVEKGVLVHKNQAISAGRKKP